jgi:hypothetical protein
LDTGTTGKQTGDRPQGKQQTGQMMGISCGKHYIALLSLTAFFYVACDNEFEVSGVRCQEKTLHAIYLISLIDFLAAMWSF